MGAFGVTAASALKKSNKTTSRTPTRDRNVLIYIPPTFACAVKAAVAFAYCTENPLSPGVVVVAKLTRFPLTPVNVVPLSFVQVMALLPLVVQSPLISAAVIAVPLPRTNPVKVLAVPVPPLATGNAPVTFVVKSIVAAAISAFTTLVNVGTPAFPWSTVPAAPCAV